MSLVSSNRGPQTSIAPSQRESTLASLRRSLNTPSDQIRLSVTQEAPLLDKTSQERLFSQTLQDRPPSQVVDGRRSGSQALQDRPPSQVVDRSRSASRSTNRSADHTSQNGSAGLQSNASVPEVMKCYVWFGNGSTGDEREATKKIAQGDPRMPLEYEIVIEGTCLFI